MNPHGGNNGLNPRHPSLDNLRRNPSNGSRSNPQLDAQQGEQNGPNRVHFPDDTTDSEVDGPLEFLLGLVYAVAAFVSAMGLVTVLVVLYLTVRPFSKGTARRLAAQIGAASFLDAIALLLPNTQIYLTGDSDVPSPVGTSIIVSNHLMDGDWWTILMLGRCVGLRGSVKVFLRNEMFHIHEHNVNGASERLPHHSLVPAATSAAGPAASAAHRPSLTNSSLTAVTDAASSFQNSNRNGGLSPNNNETNHEVSPELTLIAKFLMRFLEFPLMNGTDRDSLFQLLRSFAEKRGAAAPVHLVLFPEGWSLHNGADRKSVLAKSNEFAKREGRPTLKHLLLPRTTGFNASLDSLRESSPVVYDVTMAYRGYDGSLPPNYPLSLISIWNILRRNYPDEIHIRCKRYSMEEVLQDASWLDKKWAEKDRLLSHFARHQAFPPDGRGFCRHRIFETRSHSIESSVIALARLLLLPCAVPILLFFSIPILWTVFWAWLAHSAFKTVFPDLDSSSASNNGTTEDGAGEPGQTRSRDSSAGTPFFPATPFASPSVSNWRDMLANQAFQNNKPS